MLNTVMENKKGFTNILITFHRSWSHTLCSATMISQENRNISNTFAFVFHHST